MISSFFKYIYKHLFISLYYLSQSTLINMIMKKDKPDDGQVLVGETVKLALVGQDRYKNCTLKLHIRSSAYCNVCVFF